MSLRQLVIHFDSQLNEIFSNQELEQHVWFKQMEDIVKQNLPRRYKDYEPSAVVLAYVKWKYYSERSY